MITKFQIIQRNYLCEDEYLGKRYNDFFKIGNYTEIAP